MSEFVKACSVIDSCKTSRQNNVAYTYILLYEKEMNRRNKLENGYSLMGWNKHYLSIQTDVEALHQMCDENLINIVAKAP